MVTGVADRVSALEMLLYPQEGSLLGELLGSISASVGGGGAGGSAAAEATPRGSVPVVLFVWGPGRIVPVRLTSFQVEEQAFSPILYPVHAKVTVGLQINRQRPGQSGGPLSKDIAIAAVYAYPKTGFGRGQPGQRRRIDFGYVALLGPKLIGSRFQVKGSRFKGYNCLKLLTILIRIRNTRLHPLGEKAL